MGHNKMTRQVFYMHYRILFSQQVYESRIIFLLFPISLVKKIDSVIK